MNLDPEIRTWHVRESSNAKCRPASYNSPKEEIDTIGRCCSGRQLSRCENTQVPFRNPFPSIFRTEEGYRGGHIITDKLETGSYHVLFTHDELGNIISELASVPHGAQVNPRRKSKKKVWLYTCPTAKGEICADSYIRAGCPIEIGETIGAGVIGATGSVYKRYKDKLVKYPIYHPLTLHEDRHKDTLSCASSFISQSVDEILETGEISGPILDQTWWLVNVVLYVDDHPLITREALLEAISNFCYDYRSLPVGTLIRQPVNYIFDIVQIDGVWSKSSTSVSYITTDFEGVIYREC